MLVLPALTGAVIAGRDSVATAELFLRGQAKTRSLAPLPRAAGRLVSGEALFRRASSINNRSGRSHSAL